MGCRGWRPEHSPAVDHRFVAIRFPGRRLQARSAPTRRACTGAARTRHQTNYKETSVIASPVHVVDASAGGSFLLRRRLVLALSMAAFAAAGCAGGGMRADDTGEMRAQIRRTAFGVPHVLASNWRNPGYGVGFAHAQDRICDLAEVYVTARAERSLFWGADKGNLESDVYRQRLIDRGATKALLADPTLALDADYKEMVAGFVAGYNKYVRETPPQQLPEACRGHHGFDRSRNSTTA
jgi:hypothetical protein